MNYLRASEVNTRFDAPPAARPTQNGLVIKNFIFLIDISDQTPFTVTDESTQLLRFWCFFQFFYYLYLVKLQCLPFNPNDAPINDVLMWLLLGRCSETTRDQQPESLTTNWHNNENVNAALNTWTSQDPLCSYYLQPLVKRDIENGKPRGSKQYMPIYLQSLHIFNDHTKSNPLSSKPMINKQLGNTPVNFEKNIFIVYIHIHGKSKVNFLRNHITKELNILVQTNRYLIRTDFEKSRRESNHLLRKRFIFSQLQVNAMPRVFKHQRWISSENCQGLDTNVGLKPNQVSVIVLYPHINYYLEVLDCSI